MSNIDLKIHPSGQFDNSAKDYKHITAVPLAAAMGAEIQGVQISELTDDSFAEIEDALFRHKMIYFRDQEMDHTDQENFRKSQSQHLKIIFPAKGSCTMWNVKTCKALKTGATRSLTFIEK